MTKKKTECPKCHKLFTNLKRHLKRIKPCIIVEDKIETEIVPEIKQDIKSSNKEENSKIFNLGNITIVNDDSLNYLETLDDNSLDCCITDPPYFIDKLDNKWNSTKVTARKNNSHIKHLPKGMKFDKNQVINLYEFYFKLSKILINKLKPGGFFLSFSSPRLYHAIAMGCDAGGFEVRDMLNWVYTQSMPKGMSVSHIIKKNKNLSDKEKEEMIEAYKDFKTPMIRSCAEPICVAVKPRGKMTYVETEINFKTGLIDFSTKVGKNSDKVLANVITLEEINPAFDNNFLVSKPSKKEKGDHNTHITVKPIKLMEHLINIFSKKDAIILDPFLGSGTTAIACKNTNRKCIGIEKNQEYFNISISRIKKDE